MENQLDIKPRKNSFLIIAKNKKPSGLFSFKNNSLED
jgi:hypothetical protein